VLPAGVVALAAEAGLARATRGLPAGVAVTHPRPGPAPGDSGARPDSLARGGRDSDAGLLSLSAGVGHRVSGLRRCPNWPGLPRLGKRI